MTDSKAHSKQDGGSAKSDGGAGSNGGPIGLDRVLVMEIARITEAAAIAAARFRGHGNERAADMAAGEAMHRELAGLPIRGTVVVGEGEADDAPRLYIGERIGGTEGPEVDIAVDPLEGATICAKAMPNAMSVMAIAERGGLLRVPDMYMSKIAIGPGYPEGIVDLDKPAAENLTALARHKGVNVANLTACILDRPRNGDLIRAVREVGASIRLIPDGDIAGVIWTTQTSETCIDIYMGVGNAPEGVLAAAALKCIGGQIQGRLLPLNKDERTRAAKLGIKDMARKYELADMVAGDVIFSATGVTDGVLLGVRFGADQAQTETIVMRAQSGTVRRIKTTCRISGTRPAIA